MRKATVQLLSLFAVFVLLSSAVSAAVPAKNLAQVLGADDFQKAGLGKLSIEELRFLETKLFGVVKTETELAAEFGKPKTVPVPKRSKPVEAAAVIESLPHGEAAFGQEEKLAQAVTEIQRVPKEIRSRIKGRFEGWSRGTIFILENGQRWRQAESGEFVVGLESPEVIIRKGALGAFYLNVVGYGSTIKVKRVE